MKKKEAGVFLSVFILLFIVLTGNVWSLTSLPTLNYSGVATSTSNAGIVSLTVTAGIDTAHYLDGTSTQVNNTEESVIDANISFSADAANCTAYPTAVLFSDATVTITGPAPDNFVYMTANLSVTLIADGSGWLLWPPTLNASDPGTLFLSSIQLFSDATHPSRYADEFSAALNSIPTDIAGMTMALGTLSGSLCAGGTFNAQGVIDGAPAFTPPPSNSAPIADAGVVFNQAACLGTECNVNLDGSQSTDIDSTPGTNDDIVSFKWFIDANHDTIYDPGELIASGETVTVSLPLGFHDVVLVVEDSQGVTADDVITVVVDAAELSFLEIEKAHVNKNGKIKIVGKLALPSGVSHFDINSVGQAAIALSSLGNVIDESVDFIEHANGNKWKFKSSSPFGINKFQMDWSGAKFLYQNGPLIIKSHHIGVAETELSVTSCDPVTIDIAGTIITIDANDNVSSSNALTKIDSDDDGDSDSGNFGGDNDDCTVGIRLPFALTQDMIINIIGPVNTSILVGDYYSAAVGKFKLHGRFDTTGIVLNDLIPKTLNLTVALGDEGFTGTLDINETTWTKIKIKDWKYKADK